MGYLDTDWTRRVRRLVVAHPAAVVGVLDDLLSAEQKRQLVDRVGLPVSAAQRRGLWLAVRENLVINGQYSEDSEEVRWVDARIEECG